MNGKRKIDQANGMSIPTNTSKSVVKAKISSLGKSFHSTETENTQQTQQLGEVCLDLVEQIP